jgi:hypothetical protein
MSKNLKNKLEHLQISSLSSRPFKDKELIFNVDNEESKISSSSINKDL